MAMNISIEPTNLSTNIVLFLKKSFVFNSYYIPLRLMTERQCVIMNKECGRIMLKKANSSFLVQYTK